MFFLKYGVYMLIFLFVCLSMHTCTFYSVNVHKEQHAIHRQQQHPTFIMVKTMLSC